MAQVEIPAVVNLSVKEFSGGTITKSAGMMTNTAVVRRSTGQGEKIYVTQRPGITVFSDASATTSDVRGRGAHYWSVTSASYFINDDTIYKNDYGTTVGSISSGTEKCTFVELGGKLVVLDAENNEAWTITDADVLAQITDADFPSTLAFGGVQLDGYLFVMDETGIIWNSDLDDPTSWNALNFIDAERENDTGIFLAKMQDHIVAFGTETVEFFYNAGNSIGSPLNRRSDISHNIGCISGESVWQDQDSVYFVGIDSRGQLGVYLLDNFKIQKVSMSDLDSFLSTARFVNDVKSIGSGFSAFGSRYYMLTLFYDNLSSNKEATVTLVFEESSTMWHKWDSDLSTLSNTTGIPLIDWTSRSGTSDRYGEGILINGDLITFNNTPSYGDAASELTYVVDGYVEADYITDVAAADNNIVMKVRVGEINLNTNNNKFMRNLEIVGPQTYASRNISIRWSDGDTETYGSDRTLDLSGRRKLSALGMFNRRHIELEYSDSEPIYVEGFEFEVDNGYI